MSSKINISCLIIRIFMFNELLNFTLNFIKTLILTCFPGVLLAIRRNLFELGWHMYLCWVNHRFLCQKVTFPGIPWTLSLRTDILIGQSIHVVIYNSYKSTWYRNMISEYEIKILKFHFLCQSLWNGIAFRQQNSVWIILFYVEPWWYDAMLEVSVYVKPTNRACSHAKSIHKTIHIRAGEILYLLCCIH